MPVFLKQGPLLANKGLRVMVMCAIAALAIGCKQAPEAKPKLAAAPVDAAQVITKDIRVADEFNGRVWATNDVDIRPRVTGYIDRIAFREGQMVRKGDLLYVIDPRPYKDAADNARAQLDREHAAADFAKIQEDRAQSEIVLPGAGWRLSPAHHHGEFCRSARHGHARAKPARA